jgi:phosphoribosylpyrophosphate synthetase
VVGGQVMFEQLAVIYALPRMFVASFTLILPFFPTGTSERVEDEGEVATAASLARMLSGIPLSRGGPTSMVVFDIHALQVRARVFHYSAWGGARCLQVELS